MLPRIVLLLIQIAAAWFLADQARNVVTPIVGRQYDIFVYAAIYAVIIMVVGFAGSLVLKNVRVPTAGTFIASLILAMLFAGATLIDQIRLPLEAALPLLRGNAKIYPFIGALLGFVLKR